jgi:tripartite-type tricarboxylate transporter receptor subunit TctC
MGRSNWTRRRALVALACAFTVSAAPGIACAQDYPSKPVTLVVPFPPGGPTDITARTLAAALSTQLGQQFVVENKPGAGGTLGSGLVARAQPDGYTLLWGGTSTLAVAPSLYRSLPYEPLKSFSPVSLAASGPLLLAGSPALQANDLREFVSLAKSARGRLNFASAGTGTSTHLTAELLKSQANIDLVHVPYKGGGPALAGVLGGEVQVIFDTFAILLPHVRSGKLKAFAVTSPNRHPLIPEIPTVAESGFPGFESTVWFGLVAPAGTPREIVQRLSAGIRAAAASPALREAFAKHGLDTINSTPEMFAEWIRTETAKWTQVVRASGARAE